MGWFLPALAGAGTGYGLSQLFGDKGGAETIDLLTKEERKLKDQIAKWLQGFVGKGAEPYPGDLYPDIPDLFTEAYEDFEAGEYSDISRAAIQQLISGEPAYTFRPGDVSERWEETYAGPVMDAYKEFVLPGIKEGFNIPGVLYSRGRGEGVAREVGGFYGQYVAPSLFTALQTGERMGFESKEAAAGRRAGALGLPFVQATQKMGIAGQMYGMQAGQMGMDYQEWLRTRAEPGWAAAMGMQIQPTQQAYGVQGSSPMGDIAQMAMATAMMFGGGGKTPTTYTPQYA